jgi:hypothetical protein
MWSTNQQQNVPNFSTNKKKRDIKSRWNHRLCFSCMKKHAKEKNELENHLLSKIQFKKRIENSQNLNDN